MQPAVTIQDAKLLISRFWRDLQAVAGRKEEAYVQSLSKWMEVADTKAVELRAASKASRQIPDTARNVIVFSNTKAQLRRKALRFQENLALNCATSLSIRSDFLDISFADSRIRVPVIFLISGKQKIITPRDPYSMMKGIFVSLPMNIDKIFVKVTKLAKNKANPVSNARRTFIGYQEY